MIIIDFSCIGISAVERSNMSTLMLLFVLMLLSLTNGQNLASFPSPTRTNYCDRSFLVANGSIQLSQALKGMHGKYIITLLFDRRLE